MFDLQNVLKTIKHSRFHWTFSIQTEFRRMYVCADKMLSARTRRYVILLGTQTQLKRLPCLQNRINPTLRRVRERTAVIGTTSAMHPVKMYLFI